MFCATNHAAIFQILSCAAKMVVVVFEAQMNRKVESILAALRNIVALRLRHEAEQFVKLGGGRRPGALGIQTAKLAQRLSAPPASG